LLASACAGGAAGGASTGAARSTAPVSGTSVSELVVRDTRPGFGARAVPGQCLYVHYVGRFLDGRIFEQSRDTHATGTLATPSLPVVFQLGTGTVMKAWDRALVGLQVGGMRELLVPYRLAYGAGGRAPTIPPRTDLRFDIELVDVQPALPASNRAARAPAASTCAAATPA
jgi:FKBP-type peptidyl-prolyl cis-trans isomerase